MQNELTDFNLIVEEVVGGLRDQAIVAIGNIWLQHQGKAASGISPGEDDLC